MLAICLVFVTLIYLGILFYKYHWDFDFWKKRNVRGPKPKKFYGNFESVIFGKTHQSDLTKKFYDEFKQEKMVGVFALNSPVLILRDLDLIKDVLIKDFSVFSDRGIHVFDSVEPLSQHLFNLRYTIWQPLRSHLTAAFTGNKELFGVTLDIADQFVNFIEKATLNENNTLDCFLLFGKYSTEVIGEYGFGLKMHQFEIDKENEFQKVGRKRQLSNWYNFSRRFIREYFPKVYKYSSIFIRNDDMTNYYVNMLQEIENFRNNHNACKKDFVGRLLKLKNNSDRKITAKITNKLLAAQAYVLFTAGADTSSVIISNGLYELAMNEVIQEKLRDEIRNILKNNKILTYADLKNMPYLDSVYKEILRKYAIRNIVRKSNASYTFYGTDVTIPKNTKIIIPHYAIQRDSDYYSNPDLFDPERFNQDKQDYRHPMAYLPFGDGPHYCIGKKWAENIIKIIILKIILNFNVKINQKARELQENDPKKVFLWPKGGIHLQFEKRRLI